MLRLWGHILARPTAFMRWLLAIVTYAVGADGKIARLNTP